MERHFTRYKTQSWPHKLVLCAMIGVLCPLLQSCGESSPLPDTGKSRVRLNVDWSGYGKDVPSGMTVLLHHSVTGEMTQTTCSDITHTTPCLPAGIHRATVFNLTEGEFRNIRFRGLDTPETARAYLRETATPEWFATAGTDGGYVAGQPEWLATDTVTTAAVEPLSGGAAQTPAKVVGTLHPRNIIHTLHVTVRTDNIGNLRSARGAISGLASGRRLAADVPDNDPVTHIIGPESWTCLPAAGGQDAGILRADIRCFGLPPDHEGTPGGNRLELQFLLADGKTVRRYDIPVGHLIDSSSVPTGCRGDNLDLYLELRLDPPIPPRGGSGGGIDIWIDDWDEYVDFNMPL